MSMVQTQFGVMVKVLRTDNGTEFFKSQCNDLLQGVGILHQSRRHHTPKQNGVVEGKHIHILRDIEFPFAISSSKKQAASSDHILFHNMLQDPPPRATTTNNSTSTSWPDGDSEGLFGSAAQ